MKETHHKEWIVQACKYILEAMGYDTSKDIHKQFMLKHGENISKEKTLPKKKNPYIYKRF